MLQIYCPCSIFDQVEGILREYPDWINNQIFDCVKDQKVLAGERTTTYDREQRMTVISTVRSRFGKESK
jgi:hypothetical protein